MSLQDKLFKFLGSKWFPLLLGIIVMCALPFTWHNFSVIFSAGKTSQYWYLVLILAMNIIAILLCVYKFMSQLSSSKDKETSEW